MRKNTFNYIALSSLILLAVIVANGAAWTILLSMVDNDDDGPAIESVAFKDDHQFLSSEKIQQLHQSILDLCFVPIGDVIVPVSAVQNSFPLSTRD